MQRGNFAVVAGALYLVAGVVVPVALALQVAGHPIDALRRAYDFGAEYLFSIGATLLLIAASFIMAAILLLRRSAGAALLATGIVMAALAAASAMVPAPAWVVPLPFLWLASRAPEPIPAPVSLAMPASRLRQFFYLACLVLMGGGALLHLLRNDLVPFPHVPVVNRFEDPLGALIEFLRLEALINLFDVARIMRRALSLLVSLGIVALIIRRIALMRQTRAVEVPDTFAGFPYGLMWAALVAGTLGYFLQYILGPPEHLAVLCVFLAFLLTELPGVRGSVAASPIGTTRRRPIFTILSVILPLLGAACLYALLILGQGAQSLGPLVLGMMAVALACVLGLAANVIALRRRERWIAVQVISFLVNFGVSGYLGLGLFAELFRFG